MCFNVFSDIQYCAHVHISLQVCLFHSAYIIVRNLAVCMCASRGLWSSPIEDGILAVGYQSIWQNQSFPSDLNPRQLLASN